MKVRTWGVLGVSLISWAGMALAQTPEPRRDASAESRAPGREKTPQLGGGPVSITLQLNIPDIQAELKLDETQRAASQKLREDVSAKMRSFYKPLEGLLAADPADWDRWHREFAEATAIEATKAVAEILKPEQFQRYKQLNLQSRGASALRDEDLQRCGTGV